MNFLAHIYLSQEDDLLKIGNFIADNVRGKSYLEYPSRIQQGIILHREIDTFTDNHPLWRKSKKLIVPQYNHYAAVIIDMYYDYFLAKNWSDYSDIPLEEYAEHFYTILRMHQDLLPEKIQSFMPIMFRENWLVKYKSIEGLRYILTQMDRRTKGISKMGNSTEELLLHYHEIEHDFVKFFEELQDHVTEFTTTSRFLLP